jgi:hypothetical protein
MKHLAILLALAAAAGAAPAAFTATHAVVDDDAAVYDQEHQYEDEYIVATPAYWTLARCERVGGAQSFRTYCWVTLEDGTQGLAEWEYFGKLFVAAEDQILTVGPGGGTGAAAAVTAGELLARVGEAAFHVGDSWLEVVTADRRRGWLPASSTQPYPAEETQP